MKKMSKLLAIMLSLMLSLSFVVGCSGGGGGDVELDEEGNIRPSSGGKTVITFWGYGDENEQAVFTNLVKDFNEINKGVIEVKYEPKPNQYTESARSALQSTKAKVDVLYVADADFKGFAEMGYLEPLDDYLKTSKEVIIDEMWETSVNRFKYDVKTTKQDTADAHYWGIPKDIGPTVIFYNETYFEYAGITVISVYKDDLDDFNAGGKDARGKTKAEYGINGEVKEKGYFVLDGKKYFNNQVPMSWEECKDVAVLVQSAARANGKDNAYGFFTEWWFNYGWSVGGDCIQYVESNDAQYNGGYWDFTLLDPTANYIVADNVTDGFTVNGNKYNAGEIISWQDKLVDTKADSKTIRPEILTAKDNGILNQLPSQRDAFVEFLRVCQTDSSKIVDQDKKGYGISPNPNSIGGDAAKSTAFTSGNLAMLVDGRWNVTNFRKVMKDKWDVAPLPQYKEYDSEGNITVHGIEAGHSGSVALCINAKSQKKNAAWKFAEYIGGKTGQTKQAESGFAIPSQKDIAKSEVFLQSSQSPKNSIIFVRAAEIQTPGDWWYLRDKAWIDDWAGVLNGDVRNGKKTLSDFEKDSKYLGTWDKLKAYTEK